MKPKPRTEGATARILVVDDHPVFREGLVRILSKEKDLTVCGEATDGLEAMKLLGDLNPDLAIVDISLEGINGIDLTRQMRARSPSLRILVLSMHKETLHADRALRAGANGYIMKREDSSTLLQAIRQVLEGHVYVSKAVNDLILNKISQPVEDSAASPVEALSDREFEIFRLIGEGYGSRQIADELNVSIKTVESHREHIREKLNLNSTFELVQHAIHWIHHESE